MTRTPFSNNCRRSRNSIIIFCLIYYNSKLLFASVPLQALNIILSIAYTYIILSMYNDIQYSRRSAKCSPWFTVLRINPCFVYTYRLRTKENAQTAAWCTAHLPLIAECLNYNIICISFFFEELNNWSVLFLFYNFTKISMIIDVALQMLESKMLYLDIRYSHIGYLLRDFV